MSDLDRLLHQLTDPSDLAWNDETYDLASARGLNAADRATLIARLLDNGRRGDARAILTLGHLHAHEALRFLDAASRSKDPWAQTARRALVLLGHGRDVVEAIAHDAAHAQAKMARVAAVMDLATIGGEVAITALAQALGDPEYEVRLLAWDGLVASLQLEPWLRGPDGQRHKTTRLELLKDFLACELPSLVRIGTDEMRALVRQLTSGATPTALGLTWTPDPAPAVSQQITAAIVDPDLAFPVEAIAKLSGIARRWAEAALVMRLDRDDPDRRAVAALARLGAGWTAPVLEQVLATKALEPEVRAAVADAVRTLTRR